MFTLRVRLILVLLFLIQAVLCLMEGFTRLGILSIVMILLLIGGYFRHGPMVVAYRALLRDDIPKLDRILREVHRPDWLRAQERAYYYLMVGASALSKGNISEAKKALEVVDHENLRTDRIRTMLECLRCEAAFRSGDRNTAAEHVAKARTYAKSPEAIAELDRFETLIQQPGETESPDSTV